MPLVMKTIVVELDFWNEVCFLRLRLASFAAKNLICSSCFYNTRLLTTFPRWSGLGEDHRTIKLKRIVVAATESELGRNILLTSSEWRSKSFSFQRLQVLQRRGNQLGDRGMNMNRVRE